MASKSTYKSTNIFHERGEAAEAFVRNLFLSRGWHILNDRTKFDGVEVDLVVEKNKRKVLLEVKHLDNTWRVFERVGTKQIQRLKYVLLGLRKREREMKIEGYVVFVLPNQRLHFISLDEII